MPTPEQLRTMCDSADASLLKLRQHFVTLQRDLKATEQNIISAQGVLAAFQAALGEPYDQSTVPFQLTVE